MTSTRPHTVVGGILLRGGRVLLCQRSRDRPWYPGGWDLVGGHIEPGESPAGALARECREELGVDIGEPDDATRVTTSDLDLTVFRVRTWTGEPVNAAPEEHQAIRWFTPQELTALTFADDRLRALLDDALGGS